MMKKGFFVFLAIAAVFLCSGAAMADVSVAWTSPPDGTSYALPASVAPTGQASASGIVGGTGLDLALVIDESGSMASYGRMAAAKAAAVALVNALPQDTTSVAVIGFDSSAHTYRLLTPLNPSKAAVISAINSLYPGGGTSIGAGINQATNVLLAGHTTGRVMTQVVLSDGVSSYGYVAAAANALANGITVHAVGVPGHSVSQMQAIAAAGGGVYTSGTLDQLVALFSGTGGNLVGIDHVDIILPDGTIIPDIAIDGLGNFILPAWAVQPGANTFTAIAYDTQQNSASAQLTIYGGPGSVPEPAAMLLLGTGLFGLGVIRRKFKK